MDINDILNQRDLRNATTEFMQSPDFAFPQNVDAEALSIYQQALKEKEYLTALRSAMMLNVASAMITFDSITPSLTRYREIARSADRSWSKSIARLLEARLLAEYYQTDAYTFDQRTLPQENSELSPEEWSGEIFRSQISTLFKEILRSKDQLNVTPISVISPLIQNAAQLEEGGMSVLDFCIYQMIDIMQMANFPLSQENTGNEEIIDHIPFTILSRNNEESPENTLTAIGSTGNTVETKNDVEMPEISDPTALNPVELLQDLVNFDEEGLPVSTDALLYARIQLLRRLPLRDRNEYAEELLNHYPIDNPLHPVALAAILDSEGVNYSSNPFYFNYREQEDTEVNQKARRYYSLIKNSLERYPASPASKWLRNCLTMMTLPEINVEPEGIVYTPSSDSLSYQIKNLQNCHILLLPVTEEFIGRPYDKRTYNHLDLSLKAIPIGIIGAPDDLPSSARGKLPLPQLKPGFYAIIASSSDSPKDYYKDLKNHPVTYINVSGISAFFSSETGMESDQRHEFIYVTDPGNGRPIKGATLRITPEDLPKSRKLQPLTLLTDTDGRISLPADYISRREFFKWRISYKGSVLLYSFSTDSPSRAGSGSTSVSLLTDLGLYHPGDKVNFVAVAVNKDSRNILSSIEDFDMTVELKNANYETVDKTDLNTGPDGRAEGSLTIPQDGLTGTFYLIAYPRKEYESFRQKGRAGDASKAGSCHIEVADYKAPTFRVALSSPAVEGKRLTLAGNLLTYSGMPLGETKVTLTINFRQSWWTPRFSNVPAYSFSTELITDSNGLFTMDLGLENLIGTGYENGWFEVCALATSTAGESRDSEPQAFSITNAYWLQLQDATLEVVGDEINIPVKVLDALGKSARRNVNYSIADRDGKIIAEGHAESPSVILPSSILPSGRYTLRAWLTNENSNHPETEVEGGNPLNNQSMTLIIWRKNDRKPPVDSPLWIPQNRYAPTAADGDSINVTFGSSYPDAYIFYQISDCRSLFEEGWIRVSDLNTRLSVPVPERGNRVSVRLFGQHNGNLKSGTIIIISPEESEKMEIKTVTFRDIITPGSGEKWKFHVTVDGRPSGNSAVMAVMSDAALNNITPFQWSFNPGSNLYYNFMGNMVFRGSPYIPSLNCRWSYEALSSHNYGLLPDPEFNLWGQRLMPDLSQRSLCAYGMASMKAVAANVTEIDDLIVGESEEDSAIIPAGGTETDSVNSSDEGRSSSDISDPDTETIEYRDMECPSAFFMPMLSTDPDGNVEIEFTAPNHNTTWALQLIAYDGDLKSAKLAKECVASKPIMISTLMPRFLLTGDKASISATVYNNTDTTRSIHAGIEIFNPTTGEVIAGSENSLLTLDPSGNGIVTVRFTVPSDVVTVGVRSTALSDGDSDGEQDLLPILPASRPVIEASTFYLTPEETVLRMRLPSMKEGDQVTLNYCDNPAWYVLTALSGIIDPDTESSLALANALYANCVSRGLIGEYPDLAEGLAYLFAGNQTDSLMISPLQKNEALKLSTLKNTPWVNNAASETERMMSLSSLLEPKDAEKTIRKILDMLAKNQGSDGGWRWMPRMESSLWITSNVLDCMAAIKTSGYLPSYIPTEMVRNGIEYVDRELIRQYNEYRTHSKAPYPLMSMIPYLLNRSLLTSELLPKALRNIHNEMLERANKEWKSLSVADKIMVARYLNRFQHGETAREIMKSVMQFASYKRDKGEWFDNLSNSFLSQPPMVVTAQCIRALKEIDPESDDIRKLCQYLILSRQTEDWNLNMSPGAVTSVADAVLATEAGNMAEGRNLRPEILLDDRPIDMNLHAEALTGNLFLDLKPEMVSGKTLEIKRHGQRPAWGGVLQQSIRPIAKVKAASVGQLKITKALLPVENVESGQKISRSRTTFSKGERIRVSLTVVNDRDLDYVLIQDMRGAFMQPADQLTEYSYADGLWILRETRKTATNFYLTYLPKGTHIITYDVFADRDGEYSTGIASAQSQYYPMITAHSAGAIVTIQ